MSLIKQTLSIATIVALSTSISTANEVQTTTMQPLTVKGELQERDVQDSQTSAVVISGEELDQSTDSNLYDVVRRTPGVTTAGGDKGFSIRGISAGNTVNITLDGMSIPSQHANDFGPYSTWDLEQIEILRGAQSTQSGRNSLAGAINLRTANPTFDQETKMRFDYGSRNSTTLSIAHNQPIVDDVLAVRVSGELLKTDGWVENPTLDDDKYDEREMNTGRIKILYKPTENLSAILGYSMTDNSGGDNIINYSTWTEDRYNTSDVEAQEGTKSRVTTLDLDYKVNKNWSVKSLTGYYISDYTRTQDLDETAQRRGFIDRQEDGTTFTQELKVAYTSPNLRAVAGLFYSKVTTDFDRTTKDVPGEDLSPILIGLGLRADILSDTNRDLENEAIFAELEYDINENWTVITGARYDMESQDFDSIASGEIIENPLGLPPGFIDAIEAQIDSSAIHDTDYSAFLPKLALVYHFNKQQSLGLTYQRGYRAGGSGSNIVSQQSYDFDPEYTDTFELAYRFESSDKKTRFNVNTFYTKWEDMQVSVQSPTTPGSFIVENAGSSTLYGAELAASHYFTDNLDLFISAAYVKTKFDEYVTAGQDYSGNEFGFAPELTASIGGVYYFFENWLVSADVNYQGESYDSPSNAPEDKIQDYTLLNAKIGYEEENWSAFIYGRNLTDKDYITQTFTSAGSIDRVRTGEPAFVGLQINVMF